MNNNLFFSKLLNSPQLNITFSTLKLFTKLIVSPIWSKSPCGDWQKVSQIKKRIILITLDFYFLYI